MDDKVFDFSKADLEANDEAEMVVMMGGSPTSWTWTFAGPGHAQGVAQSNRIAREDLYKTKQITKEARANGKKWKAEAQTPEELLSSNVTYVTERLLRWSPVRLDGADYPFSADNARALLMDRRKGALLQQAIDFLLDDTSFTKRSPKT
jgi:hypothetical protein